MKPHSSPLVIIVSIAGILLAIAGIYFGAILPLLKAQSFIQATHRLNYVQSVDDFQDNFDEVFNFYSPVGAEETAKFLGNNVFSYVNQGQSEDVSRQLVAYAEKHLLKDEVRHLLVLGNMHQVLWRKYQSEEDYNKAVEYFEKAHAIGPNLPPPLYSLLNLYGLHDDRENFTRIGNLILANWPQDRETLELLN